MTAQSDSSTSASSPTARAKLKSGVPSLLAVVCLVYGALAAALGASLYRMLVQNEPGNLVTTGGGFVVAVFVVYGLAFMRKWAWKLTLFASYILVVFGLGLSGLYVLSGYPFYGVIATCVSGLQFVVIRYLKRPVIRTLFGVKQAKVKQAKIKDNKNRENEHG